MLVLFKETWLSLSIYLYFLIKSELGGQANEDIGKEAGIESFLMKGSAKIY